MSLSFRFARLIFILVACARAPPPPPSSCNIPLLLSITVLSHSCNRCCCHCQLVFQLLSGATAIGRYCFPCHFTVHKPRVADDLLSQTMLCSPLAVIPLIHTALSEDPMAAVPVTTQLITPITCNIVCCHLPVLKARF